MAIMFSSSLARSPPDRFSTRVSTFSKPRPKPVLGPLKRKLEAAEQVLARENAALAEIDEALADPALYVKNPAKVAELNARRSRVADRLATAEAAWIALAEEVEMAQGAAS